jgi:hypothetical protein
VPSILLSVSRAGWVGCALGRLPLSNEAYIFLIREARRTAPLLSWCARSAPVRDCPAPLLLPAMPVEAFVVTLDWAAETVRCALAVCDRDLVDAEMGASSVFAADSSVKGTSEPVGRPCACVHKIESNQHLKSEIKLQSCRTAPTCTLPIETRPQEQKIY